MDVVFFTLLKTFILSFICYKLGRLEHYFEIFLRNIASSNE